MGFWWKLLIIKQWAFKFILFVHLSRVVISQGVLGVAWDIADHVPLGQNIPLWYSYKSACFTHVCPVGWGEGGGGKGFECFDSSLSGPLWRCDRHFYLRLWNITLCHIFWGWSFMWKWLLRKSSPKLLEEFEHISVREILCWFQTKVKAIEQTLF